MNQSRRSLLLLILAVAFVSVPFLFWQSSWFGRRLEDPELDRYLGDNQRPRRILHALSQIADRIAGGDHSVERWYGQVAFLTHHPATSVRTTAAWVMGQDNTSEEFHRALLDLLQDPDLMVRRNAALSLVRFGDSAGHTEILAMLQSTVLRAPEPGLVSHTLKVGQPLGPRGLLARVQPATGKKLEVRSPFAGQVSRILAADGAQVVAGDALVSVSPNSDQVWEALRGLYFVGRPEDLPVVERYGSPQIGVSDPLRRQALATAQVIRSRSERHPSR